MSEYIIIHFLGDNVDESPCGNTDSEAVITDNPSSVTCFDCQLNMEKVLH